MAQTLLLNDTDIELTIDTSTGTNDLRVTGAEGQKVLSAIRQLKQNIPTLKKVLWDIPGGGIVGRLGVWADGTPRILYLNFSNLTLPSPNFYHEFINGSWTEQEVAFLGEIKNALLEFNATHVLTSALGRSVHEDQDAPWDRLFAYWPMSESSTLVSGSARQDSFGTNVLSDAPSVFGSVISAEGKRGNSVQSTTGAGLLRTTTAFRPTSYMTHSMWFYAVGPPSVAGTLVAAFAGAPLDYEIFLVSPNTLSAKIYDTTGSFVSLDVTITADQWNHVIVEIDPTAKTVSVTLNGVGPLSTGPTANPLRTTSTNLAVCAGNATTVFRVDEYAVFFAQLTASEKAALYNAGVGRFY